MKVYVKNKLFSIGGSSSVLNENKEPVYNVKGKWLSFTRKKRICDLDGNVLYTVRNKWFNWFVHSAYIYDANKNKIAKVKDKWFNVKREYIIEGYESEISIQGNFFSLTSEIIRNNEVIGTIRRQITFIQDAFEVEASEEDMPFVIALVIAIDNITDKKRR